MHRKSCPKCSQKMPIFIFTANRKIRQDKDIVYFYCSKCNQELKAISNEEHKKNFMWILLSPLFATPLIFSLKSFFNGPYLPIYFLVSYALSIMIPTVIGQHKMDFQIAKDGEWIKQESEEENE